VLCLLYFQQNCNFLAKYLEQNLLHRLSSSFIIARCCLKARALKRERNGVNGMYILLLTVAPLHSLLGEGGSIVQAVSDFKYI